MQKVLSFKSVVHNIGWLTAQKFFMMGLNFITAIIVLRYLGPRNLGIISYAQAVLAIFTSIVVLGLNQVLVKKLVGVADNKRDELIGSAFLLILSAAILCFLLMAILVCFTQSAVAMWVGIVIALSILFQAFNVIDYYLQSILKSKYFVFAQVLQTVVSVIYRVIFVLWQLSVFWFAFAIFLDALILGLATAGVYSLRVSSLFKWKPSLSVALELIKDSWPLIFAALAVTIYMRIDQVMIHAMLSEKALGLYSAAVKLIEFWYFVPVVVGQSLFPFLVNLKKIDNSTFAARCHTYYRISFWLPLFVSVFVSGVGSYVVAMIYGRQYVESGGVLEIGIWASIFVFLGVATSNVILISGNQKLLMYRTAFGAAVNVMLNLVLIPRYGIDGAAIATVASQFCAAYLFLFFHSSSRPMFFDILRAVTFLKRSSKC